MAACWEFIIPGKGMDVVNIGADSFSAAVDGRSARAAAGDGFDGILRRTAEDIGKQVSAVVKSYSRLLLPPAPYYSVVMDGCLERGRDLRPVLRYSNFGIHGAASSNAADALAAVERLVFKERSVLPPN